MSEKLRLDYDAQRPKADAFLREFLHQFSALVSSADVSLGVPVEGRVKDWKSLSSKLERKELAVDSCVAIADLIGVRVITLFRRDVEKLCRLVEKTFTVHSREDKEAQMEMSRFGYLSHHFIVSIPKGWKRTPAFAGLDFRVEIQIRTGAQHIWAAASHLLQYKKEADVPPAVARSIYRVAALLETVDLEFERVLNERSEYARSRSALEKDTTLDADNLRLVLDQMLPAQNRISTEAYSELLEELAALGVLTVGKLKEIITSRLKVALEKDRARVDEEKAKEKDKLNEFTKERVSLGVFFTHVGLVRGMLRSEFGKKGSDIMDEVMQKRSAKKQGNT